MATAKTKRAKRNKKNKKERFYQKQEGRCKYCDGLMELSGSNGHSATWDHVIPRCDGGKGLADNRVLACYTCNQAKGNHHVGGFHTLRELQDETGLPIIRPSTEVITQPSPDFLCPPKSGGIPDNKPVSMKGSRAMFNIIISIREAKFTGCEALDFCRSFGLPDRVNVQVSPLTPSVKAEVGESFARTWFDPRSTYESMYIDVNSLAKGELVMSDDSDYVLFAKLSDERIRELFINARVNMTKKTV